MRDTPWIVYTDGACSGNPGPGGWGVVIRRGEHLEELSGGENPTTNNRMEMLAAIHGLEHLPPDAPVKLHTASTYVKNGITQWIHNWRRKNWRTSSGSPVKNVALWQRLDTAAKAHNVEWVWVKGHAGIPDNERADELARMAMPR